MSFDDMIRCVDCKLIQPKTDTNYTLISPKFGWRLTKTTDANGTRKMEWRCPECWARHKLLLKTLPP
jgi:hypothetical protein